MSKVSVIIATFNSRDFIKSCLDSILDQDYKAFEIILVDNGSRDGTIDLIKRDYPKANLIVNQENLGACRARNQGIEASRGEWILSLDCDVTLERDFFSKVLRTIKDLPPEIGIVQPKILKPGGETIYSCGIYLSRLRRFYDLGKGEKDSGQFKDTKRIFGACSAAAIYRRKMLQDIKEDTGYFDERFFFLAEDVDLAWRAQRKRWKALFYPQLVCCHTGNSSNTSRQLRQYLCFRNRYFMIKKNESLTGKLKLFILSFWYEVFRFFYLVFTNKYMSRSLREIMK